MSAYARRELEYLGVEVQTGMLVGHVGADHVIAGGQRIRTHCVLWSAGTRGAPLLAQLGVPHDRMGRVVVSADGSVPGHPEVFVVGDGAHLDDEASGAAMPGVAQVAMQMGRHAAQCIEADIAGQPRRPFKYSDRGELAVIGRGHAACEIGKMRLTGLPAWLIWALST
jgi:NADH dehydrogenase